MGRDRGGGHAIGGVSRRLTSPPFRTLQSAPPSNRLLLPLCALCLYLLYAQLAAPPRTAVPAAARGGGSAALSVRVSRAAPARAASARKIAAGRPDASTRDGLAAADAAAAALAAQLAAGHVGGGAVAAAAVAAKPATADAAAQAAGRATPQQQVTRPGAGLAMPLNPALQPGALAQRDPSRLLPASEVAASIIAAAARSAAAGNEAAAVAADAAAAKAAAALPKTADAVAKPADPRPALAHDPAAQPLAEPASAAAAAEAELLRSTLRDPVDPVPPAGAGVAAVDYARRLAVRAAMAHAWAGYVAHAWGQDEVAPVSKHGYQTFCSLGATLIDSLDTLHIMGFKEEFARARATGSHTAWPSPPTAG